MEITCTYKSLLFFVIVLELFIGVIFYEFDLLNEFSKEKEYTPRLPRNASDLTRSNIFRRESGIQMSTLKKVKQTVNKSETETNAGMSRSLHGINNTVLNTTMETNNNQIIGDIFPDYQGTFLLMMVMTTPDSFKRRHVIRTTWGGTYKQIKMAKTSLFQGRNISTAIELVFILGFSGDEHTDSGIQQEADKFGDILRVSINESYKNIVHKLLMAFSWANTIKPRFILKADHDVYINIEKLRNWLLVSLLPKNLYSGFIHTLARVSRFKRDPHYVSRKDYNSSVFPDYCAGPCYVISRAFLSRMLTTLKDVNVFEVEDAFIGVVADHLGIKPFRTDFFRWDRKMNNMYRIRHWNDEDLSNYICLSDSLQTNIIDYLHFRYMKLSVRDLEDDFAL